ncbi:regulatory protein RecX [Nocardioides panaciterrulae]|uniref:Regulatory protein RecX n=1 Tax=Nocardioides panaciterrulae TaxID=661492 RepID=A0A7Y9E6S0_9ACTN|nr:regulatory protein RecX [Nocardioides panaciterrulae]NYD42164.1 regulatory protein [Nocardioides panaciterrulae]
MRSESDPDGFGDDRPPPGWLGDVAAGVDAWTQRASGPTPAVPDEGPQPRGRRGRPGAASKTRRREPAPEDPAARGPEADPESVARKILLDQLTGQARSRQQLADKLAAKDVPADLANRLLDRFEEVGLIDDEAFARAWIASRQPGKGLARRALAQELRRKGVDDEVARTALDEIDPADEEQAARALVRKKLRSLTRVDDTTATRRLVGLLARKGYASGLAFSVVRQELSAAGRDEPAGD